VTAPLFLLGAQRSGTTALAYALSAAVAEQQGGTFTVNGKLWYVLRRWLDACDLRAQHLRADEMLHALHRRPAQGVGAPEWLADVERALRTAAREVGEQRYRPDSGGMLALCRAIASEVAGSRPWGDKYNEYLLDLPYLDRLFPDARWIVLSRHPAEVTASMLAWTGDRPWNPTVVGQAESKWAAWNQCWLDFRVGVDPSRAVEVDYADLCSGAALDELASFTGLDLSSLRSGFGRRRAAPKQATVGESAAEVWSQLRSTTWRASAAVVG